MEIGLLHKKSSFLLKISSVNLTKSAVSCGFGHIYWRNPSWKTSCAVDAEWILNPAIFQKTIKHLKFEPDLNCFASWLNTQLPKYSSYEPDPYAYSIDVFSVPWGFFNCYLFTPLV